VVFTGSLTFCILYLSNEYRNMNLKKTKIKKTTTNKQTNIIHRLDIDIAYKLQYYEFIVLHRSF